MKNTLSLVISLWSVLGLAASLQAQTNLLVTTNSPTLLDACGAPGLFEVAIYNDGNEITAGITVTYSLPYGMSYVPGSVQGAQELDITKPYQPVFALPELPACKELVFSLLARKDCSGGSGLRNTVDVTAGVWKDTVLTDPYSIRAPNLSFLQTEESLDSLNGYLVRQLTIMNTGLLGVDSFRLRDIYTNGAYKVISLSGATLVDTFPASVGSYQDTTVIQFSGSDFSTAGDLDDLFEPGEQLTLTMIIGNFKLCEQEQNVTSTLILDWGCSGSLCSQASYWIAIQPVYSAPTLSVQFSDYESPGFCSEGFFEVTVRNIAKPQLLSSATAYDVYLDLQLIKASGCLSLFDFKSGDTALTPTSLPNGWRLYLSNLAPGDSCVVRFKTGFQPGCALGQCGSVFQEILNPVAVFKDNCGQTGSSYGYAYRLEIENQKYTTHLLPAYHADSLINFQLALQPALTGFSCTDDSAAIKIFLPSIATLAPNAVPTANGQPLAYSLSGNTLTLLAGNFQPGVINVPLLAVCDMAGSPFAGATRFDSLRFEVKYFCESEGCPASIPLYCGTSSVFQIYCIINNTDTLPPPPPNCLPPCVPIGNNCFMCSNSQICCNYPPPPPPKVVFTSEVFNTAVSGATGNALPFDTLAFTVDAEVMTFYPALDLDFLFKYKYKNGNDTLPLLTYAGSHLDFYDNETGIWHACGDSVKVSQSFTGIDHEIRLYIDDLFYAGECLSGLSLSAGDQIRLEFFAAVRDDIPNWVEPVEDLSIEIAISKPGTGYHASQGKQALDVNLYSGHIWQFGGFDAGACDLLSCDTSSVRIGYRQVDYFWGNLFDPFPNDYRPLARLDTLSIILPEVLQWVKGSEKIVFDTGYVYGTPVTQAMPVQDALKFDTTGIVSGYYRLTAVKDSTWPIPDFALGRRYWLEFQTVHPCYASGNFAAPTSVHLTNYLYTSNPALQTDILWTKNTAINTGQLDITASPASITATDTTLVEWTIVITHPYSNFTVASIPYPWLAFLQNGLEILDFTEYTNPLQPSPISLLPYGSNGAVWVKLGEVSSQQGARTFRLRARIHDCQPGSIRYVHGFNCKGYPDNPDAGYPFGDAQCAKWIQEGRWWYYPQKPGFYLEYVGKPDSLIGLCEPFEYEILVQNYKSGVADSLDVRAWLPEGVTLLSAEIKYPQNGVFQLLPAPDTAGGIAKWSIPPSIIAKLSGQEKTPLNTFLLRVKMEATCEFIPGLSPAFGASGKDICGERHASPLFHAPSLHLDDAGTTEANDFDLQLTLRPNENCAAGARMRIRLRNDGGAPSGTSLPGQKVRVVLDDSFNYLPGSCTAVHNFGLPGDPAKTHVGDWIILEWELLPGISVGDSIVFDIGIVAQCLSNCDKMNMTLQSTAPSAVLCGTDQCAVEKVTNEKDFQDLDILPRFQFTGVSASSQLLGNGLESVEIQYSLKNTTPIPAPGSLRVSFFVDINKNGFYDPATDSLSGEDVLDGHLLLPFTTLTRQANISVHQSSVCHLLAVLTTDGNDCTCYPAEIVVPPPPLLDVALPDKTACLGEPVMLGDHILSTYIHWWQPSDHLDSSNVSNPVYQFTGNAVNGTSETLYVRVERSGGCLAFQDTIVVTNYQLEASAAVVQDIPCNGLLEGAVKVETNYLAPPMTYIWNNGSTQPLLTGIGAGSFTVTVTDAYGCTANASLALSEPAILSANLSFSPPGCFGANDGSTTVEAAGGTPPMQYLWNTADTSPILENLSAGTYSLTVTDANGCQISTSVVVNGPTPLEAATVVSSPLCHDYTDGSISVLATGGTPSYTYQWSTGQSDAHIFNLGVGNYALTLSDANGCDTVFAINLTKPDKITLSVEKTDVVCYGDATGQAVATATGGTPPVNFTWNNGTTGPTAAGLMAGIFILTGTDAHGCSRSDTISISQPPELSCSLTAENASCADHADGAVLCQASGGVPPFTCLWSNGTADLYASDLAAGTYIVTVIDAHGCTKIASALVTVNADTTAPTVEAGNAQVALNQSGEAPLSSGLLGVVATDNCALETVQIIPEIFDCNDIGDQEVTVTAFDAAGNFTSLQVTVTIVDTTAPTVACPDNMVRCPAENPVLYPAPVASDNCLSQTGGQWAHVAGLASGSVFPVGATTLVSYTYTDASGNVGACTFEVTITSEVEIKLDTILHDIGGQGAGSIQVTLLGGTAPFSLSWSINGQLVSTAEDPSGLTTGYYDLQVTDANDCVFYLEDVFVDNLTGIAEPEWAQGLRLQPNPTTGVVRAIFLTMPDSPLEIKALDGVERVVLQITDVHEPSILLDFSTLPAGVYTVCFQTETAFFAKPLVVLR